MISDNTMSNGQWIVLTSIHHPTPAVKAFAQMSREGWSVLVVGDVKTPLDWSVPDVIYLSIQEQHRLFGKLSRNLPYNHYARKNLGYLYAMMHGATLILDTDDDNLPYDSFGKNLDSTLSVHLVKGAEWVNIYRYFSQEIVWPRGLPLDEIQSIGYASIEPVMMDCPVHQFLADEDPDVDAIYRLVLNQPVTFRNAGNFSPAAGCWVPFNSQNTLFYSAAFSLMYLPCHVSFRMTDIWRSFVAQQALWIKNKNIVFRPATVRQVRNEHNLMKDFSEEIPGYLGNKKIIQVLRSAAQVIPSSLPISFIVQSLWQALLEEHFICEAEMELMNAWFDFMELV
ncbi:MAG: DUF288 domain-containing protein [Proteobacteria bacterium]|nr:DUF288 domain-containing protein [Pseudomonadota bacterium]MDE3207641.1 DUF288 domain-containing protein [Pseudomonadota bacterium]